ncbi:hypothetical protein FXF51_54500 [Nonomuraea sp. PA05]|uniref:hypothetical protein n=1 Tax=Nonomuraea sp. PA05 TaxID=2604466 RepID=UPI0011D5DA8A|nr:hypothetical protein [Nonomuraea sp. PA05]TYB51046.1 hypothetical protein FXF51_54500 [Nonomuraea sp. PA05]
MSEGTMTREQPGPQDPDPNQTIRHRYPHPAQPDEQGPPDAPSTRRLEYTPDMLPDVQLYEAKPVRSGWWWVIVVGGLVLLIAAVAVAAVFWLRSGTEARALPTSTVTLG